MPMNESEIYALLANKFGTDEIELCDTMGNQDYYEITITSKLFEGMSKIDQHKMVYNCLGSIVGKEVHSVTVKTKVK